MTRILQAAARRRLIAAAFLAAMLTMFPSPRASAQQQAAVAAATSTTSGETTEAASLDEVVVTGSRIAAPNAASTSPIQVVTARELQQGGKTDIIDLINQLPQNFQNASIDFSNTSSALATPGGISTADLRGLGPQRTLVLVDGRRLGVGDPNTANPNSSADLDQIPAGLVERIEVVTGGASAVYGSDAIAGVVNFIMKKDFQGIQIDGQAGEYWHDNHEGWTQQLEVAAGDAPVTGTSRDGRGRSFDILLGSNIADGRGNVTAYLSYLNSTPIASGDRDFGGCQLNLTTNERGVVCGGSSSSNWFVPANGNTYSVVGNQLLPWPQAGSNPPANYNSQTLIYMSRGDERYNAGLMGHIDINDAVKPYVQFGFMDDKTKEDVAPSGLFKANPFDPLGIDNFNINCDNPLLSAQERSTICTPAQIATAAANTGAPCATPPSPVPAGYVSPNCASVTIGRRNVEGGGREAFWDHTNYRAVLGATGELATAWSYDVYASYYTTTLFNSNANFFNYTSVNNALQVSGTPANPQCISGPPCVPWNIWTTGGVTQGALNYLYSPGTSYGTATERIEHGDVTGDLGKYGIKSPLANDGIAVNAGFEHRNDFESFEPDAAEISNELSGFGGASVAIDNSVSVTEGFIELRAPLAQDKPGVRDLVLDSGYRYSDYNLSGGVNTYKFEVQYAPVQDLRFRGGYQRAIRAPNIQELFTPQAAELISAPGTDPCAPTRDPVTGALIPASASFVQCARTGVTAAEYGNGGTTNTVRQCTAEQCGQLAGGNPALKPEQSESLNLGLNFNPTFLPGFTSSLDYYRIKIKDEIGTIAATLILQNCLNTGDPTYCSLVERSSTGSLQGSTIAGKGYIVQTGVNVGAAAVSGIDVQAAYRLPLEGWGHLAFLFSGSYLLTSTTTSVPGGPTYDCAGLYGPTCLTVNPRWRHNLRTTWITPWNVELSALWRFIGKVGLDGNSPDPSLNTGSYDAFDAAMPNISYIDLSAAWQALNWLEIRAGANNLLDKDPPVVSSSVVAGGAANSFPTYDQLGRQLYVAFTAKF
jgi:outer membrane receptor protein involved in Fe transport